MICVYIHVGDCVLLLRGIPWQSYQYMVFVRLNPMLYEKNENWGTEMVPCKMFFPSSLKGRYIYAHQKQIDKHLFTHMKMRWLIIFSKNLQVLTLWSTLCKERDLHVYSISNTHTDIYPKHNLCPNDGTYLAFQFTKS